MPDIRLKKNPKRDDRIFRQMYTNNRGQEHAFHKLAQETDEQDFFAYIDGLFGLPTAEPDLPLEPLRAWIKSRCVSRKTRDDWTGIKALWRAYGNGTLTQFQTAIGKCGYGVNAGMVSKLILKEDRDAIL